MWEINWRLCECLDDDRAMPMEQQSCKKEILKNAFQKFYIEYIQEGEVHVTSTTMI